MKIGRKVFGKDSILLLILAVILIQVVPAAASPTGAVTGKFGTTVAPEVGDVSVYYVADPGSTPIGDSDVAATSLMPLQVYDIKVTVTDADTIDDLDQLVLKLWYDEYGNRTDESSHFDPITGGDPKSKAIITWTKSGGDAAIDATSDAGDGITAWSLVDSDLPEAGDFTGTSFDFIFRVQIGKVANYTAEGSKWQIAARVSDAGGLKDYMYYEAVPSTPGLRMEWYGEVEVPDAHEVVWSGLNAGGDFGDAQARTQAFTDQNSITYISNGYYREQVKAANEWTSGEDTATLTADAAGPQEFALRIDAYYEYDEQSATTVGTDFAPIAQYFQPTSEEGKDRYDYWMYIKLNSGFKWGVYSGSITFGISNML